MGEYIEGFPKTSKLIQNWVRQIEQTLIRQKSQPYSIQRLTQVVLQLIIIMQLENNLFLRTAQKVTKQSYLYEVLEYQDSRFQFKPFKIEKLSPERASITYQRILKKYSTGKDFKIQTEAWLESEKRLFAWFIVFYTYLNRDQNGIKTDLDFSELSTVFFGKCPHFLEFNFLILLKTSKKVCWDQEKDKLLLQTITQKSFHSRAEGMKWNEVSRHIFMSTQKKVFRSPKSCRERWLNHLDFTKVKGNWTDQQDLLIFQNVVENTGKKWSKLVGLLGNKRTEHTIKNRFNALIARNRRYKLEKDLRVATRLLNNLRKKLGEQDILGKDKQNGQEPFKIQENPPQNQQQKFKVEVQSDQNYYNRQLVSQSVGQNEDSSVEQKQEQESSEKYPFLIQAKQQLLRQAPLQIQFKQQPSSPIIPITEKQPEGLEINDYWGRAVQPQNHFPFQNYTYQASLYNNYTSQILEYHKNQMMFYQQFMALPQRSTNDTNLSTRQAKIIEDRRKKQENKEQDEYLP